MFASHSRVLYASLVLPALATTALAPQAAWALGKDPLTTRAPLVDVIAAQPFAHPAVNQIDSPQA
jgi:hypothetical protein